MPLIALTTGEIVLWGAATAATALLMAGMMNRRRAHLTDTLRDHVRRQRGGGASDRRDGEREQT